MILDSTFYLVIDHI